MVCCILLLWLFYVEVDLLDMLVFLFVEMVVLDLVVVECFVVLVVKDIL